MFNIRTFIITKIPGARASREKHSYRAGAMQQFIVEKFGPAFHDPHLWKIKHIRACLDMRASRSVATAYDYFRTARAVLAACGRWDPNTDAQLRGPWRKDSKSPNAGRPALLPFSPSRTRISLLSPPDSVPSRARR